MLLRSLIVVLSLAVLTGGAWAEDTATDAASVASEPACQGCPIAAAMEKLPQLTFAIGEECTSCSHSAAKLAKQHSLPIRFAVGEETFDDEGEAKLALLAATEEYIENFATPHTCKVSGNTTIAGKSLQCTKSAGKLASLVKDAISDVQLTYRVAGEDCGCPTHAASLAKSSGKEMLFVVGEEATPCETTARLNLARAKFRAAMQALVEAEKQADAGTQESATKES